MAQATESRGVERHAFITGFHGIRYQVKDVARAVAFYTQHLASHCGTSSSRLCERVAWRRADSAQWSRSLRLATDAEWTAAEPGGWNRVVLNVSDLPRSSLN
jgi:glyoxylase I family protein